MNWEAIGAIGEVLGAILVLATLVYLGRQIQHANVLGKAEAERDWFSSWHDVIRSFMGTPENASIARKGLNAYDAMDPDEKASFSANMICLFDYADVLRRLHEKGLVTDDVLDPVIRNLLGLIHTPGGSQWWGKVGPILTIYSYITSLSLDEMELPEMLEVMDYFDPTHMSALDDA